MLIKQKRINSCNCFAALAPDTPVRLKVEDVRRFGEKVISFGFKETDENGISILPSIINRYAKKNAEPFYIVNKSLPLEEYTQVVYWTRHEWAGKGQVNPVTAFSYIKKKRYHRDCFAPFSVCFTLKIEEEKLCIISDEIILSVENYDKLINTVNMLLDLFGECIVDFTEQKCNRRNVVVNWDILPKGEYPWDIVKGTLSSLAKGHTKTRTVMMLRNCEAIYAKHPDFVAYGRSGFKGYAVFGFSDRNLYILESIMPNNATYVLENDWEAISRMSKAEILSQELHKARIVHSEKWQKNLDMILEGKNG